MRGLAQPLLTIFATVLLLAAPASAAAQDFYKGKTIRIIVGFSPGGAFDVYSRAIARHIGKHISGSPTIVVENMPGAGSLILANQFSDFLAEMKKAALDVDPVAGAEVERIIHDHFKLDAALLGKLKDIFYK